MRFGVLGSLEVHTDDGSPVRVNGPVRRLLLAALLARPGRVVPADTLITDVWGTLPPRTAAQTLRSHLVRLRDDLGPGARSVLQTDAAGYRLEAQDVDALNFERLTREDTVAALDTALALWRGDAYLEFGDAAFAAAERLRLTQLRTHARERRVDLLLDQGRAGEVIGDLEAGVTAEPYRERSWEQLIVALYRSGRQADALGAYRRARELLVGDLGIEPGPGLRDLESRVLRQDADLLRPHAAPAPATAAVDRCPYRGLEGFEDSDADLFVGRERVTAELAGLLATEQGVLVTGPSGCGKSSLLHAGLIPALRGGALPGSAAWRVHATTPSTILGVDKIAVDLIVMDQAEELVTALDADERAAVVGRLLTASQDGARIVLGLRGDYVGRLAELGALADLTRTTLLVRPLRDDEIRRVVLEPAMRVGCTVEPEMLDAVLDEISGRPGALPLLSVALTRAWANRDGNEVTLDGYRRGGGLAGALEASAEEVYQGLPAAERADARRVLPRLATLVGGVWARRPLFIRGLHDDESQVLLAFARDRLVTIADGRAEIVHDAVLAGWPRLAGWLDERTRAAELLEHLDVAARAWDVAGRQDNDLYRGARLQAALDWRDAQPADLGPLDVEFLDAAQAATSAELAAAHERADREARGRRRLRALVGVLTIVMLVAMAAVAVSLAERSAARRAAGRADSAALGADARRLAALSLSAPDLRTSLLLAVAAYRLQDSPDTRSALLSAVETGSGADWRIPTANRVQWLRTDARADTVWAFDNQHEVLRVDVAEHRIVGRFALRGAAADAVSPDGRLLAVVEDEGQPGAAGPSGDGSQVIVQDARTGTVRATLPVRTVAAGFTVPSVAFTGDGRRLVVVQAADRAGERAGSRIAVFDVAHLGAAPRTLDVGSPITGVATGRTDIAVATASGALIDADADRVVVLHRGRRRDLTTDATAGGLTPLALSADGTHLAVGLADDRSAVVLPTAQLNGTGIRTAGVADLDTLAFSPSGLRIATGAEDGAVSVSDVRTGAIENRFTDSGPVHGLAWGGTSDTGNLFSGGLDSQITDWSLGGVPPMFAESGPPVATAFAVAARSRGA